MNTPYRDPSQPEAPRVRHRWVVRWSEDSSDAVNILAHALFVFAGIIGFVFIFVGLCPEVRRAMLVWAIFAAAWCVAFVRREVMP